MNRLANALNCGLESKLSFAFKTMRPSTLGKQEAAREAGPPAQAGNAGAEGVADLAASCAPSERAVAFISDPFSRAGFCPISGGQGRGGVAGHPFVTG